MVKHTQTIRRQQLESTYVEFLFNKVAGMKTCNFITPTHAFSCEYCEFFENTYFAEHLQTTASDFSRALQINTLPKADSKSTC